MPIVNGLEKEYGKRITFVRSNIHTRESIALQAKYGFTATPEFFLVDANGNILAHWDEELTVARFKQSIDRFFIAPNP